MRTTNRAALIARLRDYTYEGDPRHLMEAAAAMLEADGKAQQQEPTGKQSLQVAKHRTTGWMAPVGRYAVPVLFNPYTGEPRDVRDVQSDPQGILIVPPGKVEMLAAPQPQRPRLTDEEIEDFADASTGYSRMVDIKYFARAIEKKVRGEA